ncbi:hypothetical protein AVEN_232385-1 [Araneus ventricosus]|uniref:Uncharacterized protein n=1 Tax=Araneus ventricosus TaxID=182803 RepID=A0A4Y2CXC5_ARAVE|nr:hypothetical protein AVEN_232385-1 [Araneus ventricosus]
MIAISALWSVTKSVADTPISSVAGTSSHWRCGQLWATSQIPVDGAAIASNIIVSNCVEHKTERRDRATTWVFFFPQGLTSKMRPSKAYEVRHRNQCYN